MTIVAVVVALIAGLGVAFWMKQEQTASAEELPYAARIQRVDGEVAFSDSLANTDAECGVDSRYSESTLLRGRSDLHT